MRSSLIILAFVMLSNLVFAQGDSKPRIRRQQPDPIRINEDTPYTVGFSNLEVRDREALPRRALHA
jgi:hypothetical protein